MAKVVPIVNSDGNKIGYCFFCPACGMAHKFCTDDAHDEGWPVWTLTGMPDSPTIGASVLYRDEHVGCCHSFVTDGKIAYGGDCTHELAGQTVDLPDVR